MPGFANLAFTDAVKALQEQAGSRSAYASVESREGSDVSLGPREARFIAERDSFYLGSVTSDGWPYIQHRGGARGFLHVLDPLHLAFADYGGNRQYVSVGNLAGNDRVALFLMDYAARARLKLLGHARILAPNEAPELAQVLAPPEGYHAHVERLFVITIAAWDWNCHQHIAKR
jgi:predicted pyridoxine 5'-phosphate oxidase superfamily flavin-nucleotide-binding protein